MTRGWKARGRSEKESLGSREGERAERRSYTSLTGIACERGTKVIRDLKIEIDL